MTIREYYERMGAAKESEKRRLDAHKSVWSYTACRGFAVMAMEKLLYSDGEIRELIDAMEECFAVGSISQAENACGVYMRRRGRGFVPRLTVRLRRAVRLWRGVETGIFEVTKKAFSRCRNRRAR